MHINFDGKELNLVYLRTEEEYSTFSVKIKSDSFMATSSFMVSKPELELAIQKLSAMNSELKGNCEINDLDSGSYLRFEMGKYGHMFVSGQICEYNREHIMNFKYATDQTMLGECLRLIKNMLLQSSFVV